MIWHNAEGVKSMKYCIAVDGGGTKTDTVLFDETGHIHRRYVGPGGNASDLGVEEAQRRLLECIRQVTDGHTQPVAALYGGVAGVLPNGDIYSAPVADRFPIQHLRFDDDGCNLISGTLGHEDGCGMVCGTGSSLFVRIQGQSLRHIGGKGYLIDTGGSGFELGQDALRMALRAVDGRCPPTVLTQLLEQRLGMPVSDRIIPQVHRGGRPYIASMAPAVFEGRKQGDWACEEIFRKHAALLADLTKAAARYFEGEFPVVLGGGIAAHFPEYCQEIAHLSHPRARLLLQQAPPVYGAAVEVMWDADLPITASFREKFLAEYAELS